MGVGTYNQQDRPAAAKVERWFYTCRIYLEFIVIRAKVLRIRSLISFVNCVEIQ